MDRRIAIRRGLALAGAAALAVSPLWLAGGQAQQVPAGSDVTTVSPITVQGDGLNIGVGASQLTVEELKAAGSDAHVDGIEARDASRLCQSTDPLAVHQSEANGDFSIEALYNTESDKEAAMATAAQVAEAATEKAQAARSGAGPDDASEKLVVDTELARQAAIKTYLAARADATEAHLRVADLQDQMKLNPTEDVTQLRSYVDSRTLERSHNGGVEGVYVPDEYKDLKLIGILARQADDKGVAVLQISGRISNPRKEAIPIPPLWFTAIDRYGSPLKSEQTTAQAQSRIPPGGSLPFTYTLNPIPDHTARAVVTFAPQDHLPLYLPVRLFCHNEAVAGAHTTPAGGGSSTGGGRGASTPLGGRGGPAGAGRAGGAPAGGGRAGGGGGGLGGGGRGGR